MQPISYGGTYADLQIVNYRPGEPEQPNRLACCQAAWVPTSQDRIRLYHKKIQKLENDQKLATSRRTTAVDIGAANRFITAAVTDLSVQQKAALQQMKPLSADERAAKRLRAEPDETLVFDQTPSHADQSASAFLDGL